MMIDCYNQKINEDGLSVTVTARINECNHYFVVVPPRPLLAQIPLNTDKDGCARTLKARDYKNALSDIVLIPRGSRRGGESTGIAVIKSKEQCSSPITAKTE